MFIVIGIVLIVLYALIALYIGWSGWTWIKPAVSHRFRLIYIIRLSFSPARLYCPGSWSVPPF